MSRRVHVIGPFNSGTNLMHNIIQKSACIDLTTNTPVIIGGIHEPFGKHIMTINTINKYLDNKNNLLIIMYKNVYNWLYSIKKECYDVKYSKMFLPVELYGKKFPNMVELYNYYYINYMSLLNKYDNVVFLDYEKVIQKNNSYEYINNTLSKINLFISSKPSFDVQLMTKAKSHGQSVKTADEAAQKFIKNQIIVKSFVNKYVNLKRSIKKSLLTFYEH
jgi:hypothetical protein